MGGPGSGNRWRHGAKSVTDDYGTLEVRGREPVDTKNQNIRAVAINLAIAWPFGLYRWPRRQ
jgi:hypothetical protein